MRKTLKRLLTLGGLLLLGSGMCLAQYTTVTATVVDSDSTVWANAPYSWSFQPGYNQSNPANYSYNGAALNPTYLSGSGAANGSGVISITTYQNTLLSPIPSSYILTVCPLASSKCATINFSTSSGSVDISSQVNAAILAPRFQALSGAYGYNDAEAIVKLLPGSTYWNTTSSISRCYTGSAWGVCSIGGSSTTIQAGTNVTISQGSPCTGTCTINADEGVLTSLQLNGGTSMNGNQGNGTLVQHSTGSTVSGDLAVFDANGNVIDSGGSLVVGGSLTITTGTLASTTCTAVTTGQTVIGVTTSGAGSRVTVGFTGDPSSLVGWGANGGMELVIWPTAANTASWELCNPTANSITYDGITVGLGAN